MNSSTFFANLLIRNFASMNKPIVIRIRPQDESVKAKCGGRSGCTLTDFYITMKKAA
jgi:hypothetical protein